MVPAFALIPARSRATATGNLDMIVFSSEVEHQHGLNVAVGRRAGLDPCVGFEEAQQESPLGAVVDLAGVSAALNDEPCGERVVVVLVRRNAELQSVDPMRERAG